MADVVGIGDGEGSTIGGDVRDGDCAGGGTAGEFLDRDVVDVDRIIVRAYVAEGNVARSGADKGCRELLVSVRLLGSAGGKGLERGGVGEVADDTRFDAHAGRTASEPEGEHEFFGSCLEVGQGDDGCQVSAIGIHVEGLVARVDGGGRAGHVGIGGAIAVEDRVAVGIKGCGGAGVRLEALGPGKAVVDDSQAGGEESARARGDTVVAAEGSDVEVIISIRQEGGDGDGIVAVVGNEIGRLDVGGIGVGLVRDDEVGTRRGPGDDSLVDGDIDVGHNGTGALGENGDGDIVEVEVPTVGRRLFADKGYVAGAGVALERDFIRFGIADGDDGLEDRGEARDGVAGVERQGEVGEVLVGDPDCYLVLFGCGGAAVAGGEGEEPVAVELERGRDEPVVVVRMKVGVDFGAATVEAGGGIEPSVAIAVDIEDGPATGGGDSTVDCSPRGGEGLGPGELRDDLARGVETGVGSETVVVGTTDGTDLPFVQRRGAEVR